MAALDVNPSDLLRSADAYSELSIHALQIAPQAAAEVLQIAETHGPMGYPTAVGIAMGFARNDATLQAKIAHFTTYSQRFTEHAATYTRTDAAAAGQIDPLDSWRSPPSGDVRCTGLPPVVDDPRRPTHMPTPAPDLPPRDVTRDPEWPPPPGWHPPPGWPPPEPANPPGGTHHSACPPSSGSSP